MSERLWSLIFCGMCVAVFVIQFIFPGFTDLFLLNQSALVEPWRFVTAIFLHGSVTHLLYNMFALFFFGLTLERTIGSKKFLMVFFSTGVFASIFSYFFYSSSLGASGAIFGVIGCLIILRPTMTVWAFGLPMPLFIAGIAWGIGDAIGTFNPTSNTATLAHLSGMGFGLLFGSFLKDWNAPKKSKERPVLDEHSIRRWEDRYLR